MSLIKNKNSNEHLEISWNHDLLVNGCVQYTDDLSLLGLQFELVNYLGNTHTEEKKLDIHNLKFKSIGGVSEVLLKYSIVVLKIFKIAEN